jgi:hypothetical protein
LDIQKIINEVNAEINSITDPSAKIIIPKLVNIIEYQAQETKTLKIENQKLRDENNKLKGGNGKPNIRPQSKQDLSSEKERKKKKKKKKKKSKNNKKNIKIDRTVDRTVDPNTLPEDAVFKGYQTVIVQDIIIKSDNVLFKKEVYYSPSLNKTFMASMPDGYEGEFGPNIKSFIITQHFQHKTTEPAIVQFLQDHGIQISAATVSRIITDNKEAFHAEKIDIIQAGLPSSVYQQMDDTGARVNGQNYYTHILCNEYYTAYFTRENKNRLTILEILSQKELTFEFNEITYALMIEMNLSHKILTKLQNQSALKTILNRQEVDAILDNLFPIPGQYQRSRQIILEASAIVAYQNLPHATKILLTDDAPQFKQITELLALCWIHDGRLYKKLAPVFSTNKDKICSFLDNYWDYYHELLEYKKAPTIEFAKSLEKEFDVIFSTITGYDQLDERINRTRFKKDSLLLVLQHPELPLHNNNSELGARVQARYRDISFQTKNQKGTESKDTFMTIIETAKKLGVNAFNYIFDRVSENFSMPSLANLVEEQSLS